MRNLARLALFFSLSFVLVFLAATGFRYLTLRVDWIRVLPQKPETFLTILINAAHWALSLAMYLSVVITLCYAARNRCFAPVTVLCMMILSIGFNFGVSFALYHWRHVPPAQITGRQLGESGLILSNSINRNETAVILLNGSAQPLGPRVTAMPDRPLFFQESTANAQINFPPIPFTDNSPWYIKNLAIDVRLNAQQLEQRFNEGITPYLIYAGSLVFLLCSLGFILEFSVWPLANLFLGILAFRGILAAAGFFNSPEMQELFSTFLKNMIPSSLVVPIIFAVLGLMVHLYTILVYMAKKRGNHDEL
ncbi:MAG: hypothetical protein FWC03_02670 [Treponema sp.]|nr:hypothetical protein [Treponema sp.]